MIRIFTANEPGVITITIDGQLVSANVDEVETCIQQMIGQQRPVHLFLREVSDIDEKGRALLSRAAAKGVDLSASGVYSSYVVERIRQQPADVSRSRLSGTSLGGDIVHNTNCAEEHDDDSESKNQPQELRISLIPATNRWPAN